MFKLKYKYMKHEIKPELTIKAKSAYAREGEVSMQNVAENDPQVQKRDELIQTAVEQVRIKHKKLKEEEGKAVKSRKSKSEKKEPQKTTEAVKGEDQIDRESKELLKEETLTSDQHAQLASLHSDRLKDAHDLLEREEPFTLEEEIAIIRAHYVGSGELGDDGTPAKIGNYTFAQKRQKYTILRRAFSEKDSRLLMKKGIAGADTADSEIFEDINDENITTTDAELKGIADTLASMGTKGVASQAVLENMEARIAAIHARGFRNESDLDEAISIAKTIEQGKMSIRFKEERYEFEKMRREREEFKNQDEKAKEYWEGIMSRIVAGNQDPHHLVDELDDHGRPVIDPVTGRVRRIHVQVLKAEARDHMRDLRSFRNYYLQEIMDEILKDDEIADMYLNLIIGIPDTKTESHYDIRDLNATSALYAFRIATSRIPEKKALRYGRVEEVRQYFHDMRHALQQGNMRDFGTLGLTINHEHFQEAVHIAGVADLNRWYDQGYAMIVKKYGSFEPHHYKEIDKWVDKRIEEAQHNGLLAREVTQYNEETEKDEVVYARKFEDWELRRAKVVGRAFFITKLRAPEVISATSVAMTTEARRWQSYTFEGAVRVFNPVRFLFLKFDMMKDHGSIWLTEHLENIFRKNRNERLSHKAEKGDGLTDGERNRLRAVLAELQNPNAENSRLLTHIGAVDRNNFEISAPQGRLGFEHGWRVTQSYLNVLPLKITVDEFNWIKNQYKELVRIGKVTKDEQIQVLRHYTGEALPKMEGYEAPEDYVYVNAGYYMETHDRISENLGKFQEYHKTSGGDFRVRDAAGRVLGDKDKEAYMNWKMQKFVEQVDLFTGMIVGHAGLPVAFKRDMWKKTARLLPARIADMLSNNRRLSEIRNGPDVEARFRISAERAEAIEEKLRLISEYRITKAEKALRNHDNLSLGRQNILEWYESIHDFDGVDAEHKITFDEVEEAYVGRLIALGQNMAIEFAAVEWPYNPYLDDAPFAAADYEAYGGEASRRRIADFDAGVQSMHAWMTIWKTPGQDPKEVHKQLVEMLNQLDAPHGKGASRRLLDPIVEAYADYINIKPADRNPVSAIFRYFLKEPKSKAQEFHGSQSPAYDPEHMADFFEALARDGVLARMGEYEHSGMSQLEEQKRKHKARWNNWLMYMAWSWLLGIVATGPWEFAKQVREGGKAA